MEPTMHEVEMSLPEEAEHHWGWFTGLGALFVILGLIALAAAAFTTLATVLLLGVLLLAAGVAQIAHALATSRARGLHAVAGVVYTIAGGLIVIDPVGGAIGLTLLLGVFFLLGGLLRLLLAFQVRPSPRWGWVLLGGIVTILLGVLILSQWPSSAFWIIGLIVGLELLFSGVTLLSLGLAGKRAPGS